MLLIESLVHKTKNTEREVIMHKHNTSFNACLIQNFTLIELLVVIAIIAILAGAAVKVRHHDCATAVSEFQLRGSERWDSGHHHHGTQNTKGDGLEPLWQN